MTEAELREIMEILPEERRLFHYFKDGYAAMLLGYSVGDGASVRAIKNSRFSGLLEKSFVREILARASDGVVTREMLDGYWHPEFQTYAITLGEWNGEGHGFSWRYGQTSRRGRNLVLQLNFSNQHDQQYRWLIGAEDRHPFENTAHPVAREQRHTLAWARIDIDLTEGEALIEEVQNDWIRRVAGRRKILEKYRDADSKKLARMLRTWVGGNTTLENFERYCDSVIGPHMELWDEAVLAASIRFLVEEIGIRRIFYHTFDGGNIWKGITGRFPPRSLYTGLPRRFGFREVDVSPRFLDREPLGRQPRRRVRSRLERKRGRPGPEIKTRLEETTFFLLDI